MRRERTLIDVGGCKVSCTPEEASILRTLTQTGVYVPQPGLENSTASRVSALRRKIPPGWFIAVVRGKTKYKLLTADQMRSENRRNGRSRWTDERVALAVTMWRAGKSARAISERLDCGITRNAVIGKMSRMNIEQNTGIPKASAPEPETKPEPLPEVFDPNSCRVDTCPNKPLPHYSHGRCRSCQEKYLNGKRTRGAELLTAPPIGH